MQGSNNPINDITQVMNANSLRFSVNAPNAANIVSEAPWALVRMESEHVAATPQR